MLNYIHSHPLVSTLMHHWVSHYAELSLDAFEMGSPDLNLACSDLRDESALTAIVLLSTYQPALQRYAGPLDAVLNVSIYELQSVYWTYLEGRYFSLDYPDGYPLEDTPLNVPLTLERLVKECIHTDTVRALLVSTFCTRLHLPTPTPIATVIDQCPPTKYTTRLWLQWVKSRLTTMPDLTL